MKELFTLLKSIKLEAEIISNNCKCKEACLRSEDILKYSNEALETLRGIDVMFLSIYKTQDIINKLLWR